MGETTSSVATRAVLSRSALRDAAEAAVRAGGRIADLRGNAFGHGVEPVARAVRDAGAECVLVDGEPQRALLERLGIPALTEGIADVDARILYGLPRSASAMRTRPPLRLTGRVLSTKRLRAGDAVSYGYTYRAPVDGHVALVTGGYAQGIVRALGNQVSAEISGVLRPIIGRVAMDVCVIDLDGVDIASGAEVTYFGGSGPARDQLARWSAVTGMSAAELLTVAAEHAVHGEED